MKFKRLSTPQPFKGVEEAPVKGTKAAIGGSNDFYGANSLEHFSSAGALSFTHEDAAGFLDYPTSFAGRSANFWLRDAGVKVWEYEEAYDNWRDTYGMDSVAVFYHSGHGNMDAGGVFQAPMGGVWDGRDWAFSSDMAFSNEELRYLFWSTCYSLRVSGPDNPVRSWWAPNKGGLRMLFGYETTSIDHPGYGKFFWEEWRKGKTFAQAFLDASWRISHSQVPVAMAVGANRADAINRLNTERFFSRSRVTKGWYQWQWIGTLPARRFSDKTTVPKKLNALVFDKDLFNDARIVKIAHNVGIPKSRAATIQFDGEGNRMISSRSIQLNVNRKGSININFGKPNIKNDSLVDESKAIKRALDVISDLDFDKDMELKLGHIRHRFTCGGSNKGSGKLDDAYPFETIVQFRQCHKGVESVNSDHGLVAIGIDNDGAVTNVYNNTKGIIAEAETPRSIIPSPKEKENGSAVDVQFSKAIHGILKKGTDEKLTPPGDVELLREKVGYDFSGNLGLVVHQRDVEVSYGKNLKKRCKIRLRKMG